MVFPLILLQGLLHTIFVQDTHRRQCLLLYGCLSLLLLFQLLLQGMYLTLQKLLALFLSCHLFPQYANGFAHLFGRLFRLRHLLPQLSELFLFLLLLLPLVPVG